MTKSLFTKIKPLTILLLIFTSTLVTFAFLAKAEAETKITSMTPLSGHVGTSVQLLGNMSTENGQYLIQFDEVNITSGNAAGYEVNASFNIPSAIAGDHNVTLVDVTAVEKDTMRFTVLISYSVETDVPELPAQRQEGDNVTILLDITGGKQDETFVANVTVQAPTNTSYTVSFNVTVQSDGNGSIAIIYPGNFSTGANTNFTGDYKVFLNETLDGTLANVTFAIGLTNSTEYHRFQNVDVKAAGYKSNENVTIAISFAGNTTHSENVTANGGGLIHYANWTIPSNASIGTYTVDVTSISPNATIKEIPDTQNFTVPGFDVNLTTRNLAGDPVQDVIVEVSEEGDLVANETSVTEGLVRLKLEIGNYTCKAEYRNETVGVLWINVTEDVSLDFLCNLTNLRIFVEDEAGNRIPEVKLRLMQGNEALFEGTTNITGIAVVYSLLPNITYVLNASRYDVNFTTTTIPQLPIMAWFNLTIICPTLTLSVNVTDAKNQPIDDAKVEAQELMGGLHYEGNTVDGAITLNCTFGKYRVGAYASGIKLNETTIDLFENQSLLINCTSYGLKVYIKVVDYLGQPISNANVTLQREGLTPRSNRTEHNGIATFSAFFGGSVQITIYLGDQTQPCIEIASSVDSSATIRIKIEKYVLIAGVFVETSHLTTALIIAAAVILILSIEIYRRKHPKSQKGSS